MVKVCVKYGDHKVSRQSGALRKVGGRVLGGSILGGEWPAGLFARSEALTLVGQGQSYHEPYLTHLLSRRQLGPRPAAATQGHPLGHS